MNHHGSCHGLLGSHVLEAEALRHQEVDLIGREREFAADRVLDLHVELWSVEGGFARRLDKWMAGSAQRLASSVLGTLPHGRVPHPLITHVVTEGEPKVKVLDAERPIHLQDQLDHPLELLVELIRAAEDVGIVDGEGPHPDQAGDLARLLVAVDRAQLEDPERELAVGALPALVDEDVEGAVHWLRVVRRPFHLHGRVHPVGVPVEVA